MHSMRRIAAAALTATAVLMPAAAGAQSSDGWQFGASIYGWFPTLKGTTTFPPPPGGGSDITVDAADIINNLKFVMMGSFEARKGRWGGFTDLIYMDLGNTKSQTRNFQLGHVQVPADVSGQLTLDMKSTVWTLAGEYRAVEDSALWLDTFLGARLIDVDQTLTYALSGNLGPIALPDRSGNRNASLTNWDGIVGVKGRYLFGDQRRWFVPFYGDVGTGDSSSTYQVMTGVGYAFEWGEIVGQWRYLKYDFGGAIDSLSFNGPAIAFNFHW